MVRPVHVLLVEDNPADVELMRDAFEEDRIQCDFDTASDGVEALEYLKNPDNARPDLILLDLNMPRMDGRELLAALKADNALSTIPVVVLTSSEAEMDILESYQLHASSYVRKPIDLKGFETIVKALDSFWFRLVTFP